MNANSLANLKRGGSPGRKPKLAGLEPALEARYGKDGGLLVDRLEQFAQLHGRDKKIAFEAVKLLMAYKFGTPKQRTEVSGPEGGPVPLTWLPPAAL